MSLRFGKRYQKDSDGNTIVIGFIQDDEAHELGLTVDSVKAICLQDDYSNLSIWSIIQKAIRICAEDNIVRTDHYRDNPFFEELERSIWNDPRYQETKRENHERMVQAKNERDKARTCSQSWKHDSPFWRSLDKRKNKY